MTLRFIHKWLSICIGLQVFIWVVSGTVISLLDHSVVSGRNTRSVPTEAPALAKIWPPDALISSAKLANSINLPITAVSLQSHQTRLAYRFDTHNGAIWFDVKTGERLSITQADAKQAARQSYLGTGQITEVERLPDSSDEIGYSQPAWRVQFDDSIATRVYVSDVDGSIIAHRNRYWKAVDFLLMLHFMDYSRQHSFNNPQIIVVAFIALWLSVSGLLLVFNNFSRHDFTKKGLIR